MVIFHSYVSLPEGKPKTEMDDDWGYPHIPWRLRTPPFAADGCFCGFFTVVCHGAIAAITWDGNSCIKPM